ncbi:hypothetical protein CRUP_010039 [Coryphaenoides rupestris]|nr:hypothetical protein CRUP_010039 [Coryphaenoides rupestris]
MSLPLCSRCLGLGAPSRRGRRGSTTAWAETAAASVPSGVRQLTFEARLSGCFIRCMFSRFAIGAQVFPSTRERNLLQSPSAMATSAEEYTPCPQVAPPPARLAAAASRKRGNSPSFSPSPSPGTAPHHAQRPVHAVAVVTDGPGVGPGAQPAVAPVVAAQYPQRHPLPPTAARRAHHRD